MITQKKNRNSNKGNIINSRRGSWVGGGKENVSGNVDRMKEKKGGIVKERSLPNLIKRNVNVNVQYEPKMKGYCDVNKKLNIEKLLPTINHNNSKSRSNSRTKSKSNEKIYNNISKERKKSYSNSKNKTTSNHKSTTSNPYELKTIKNSKSASNLKSTASSSSSPPNNNNNNNIPIHPPLPVSPFTLTNNPASTTLKRSSTNSKLLKKSPTISHLPRKPLKPIIHHKYATSLLSQAGKTEDYSPKQNQDSALILSNIFSLHYHIYAVMDGHGTYGHLVSQHIKSQIEQTFTNASTFKTPKQTELTEAKILSMLLHKNNTLIRKFITNVHQSLLHERFDTNFSGSTCIIVFHILNTLITVNVGDSRAILIKRVFNMKQSCSVFEAEALSVDHKPQNEDERKRIEKMGGSVEQCKDEVDNGNEAEKVYRVWVKGETFPGIAMSRSIGDFVAKTVGVCCEPDINVKYLDDSAKVIVVGSDGVFEFLGNNDIAGVVKDGYEKGNVNATAKEIVRKATEMWTEKEDGMDDITVVVVFIGENNSNNSVRSGNGGVVNGGGKDK